MMPTSERPEVTQGIVNSFYDTYETIEHSEIKQGDLLIRGSWCDDLLTFTFGVADHLSTPYGHDMRPFGEDETNRLRNWKTVGGQHFIRPGDTALIVARGV